MAVGTARPPRPVKTEGFESFQEFWPFYLKEHNNRTNRRLHVIGTSLAIIYLLFCLLNARFGLALVAPVIGYGFAWVGHFVFQKNKPATFKYPGWSLRGDFTLVYQVYSGKIKF